MTMNVDGYHQRAGSSTVHEVHGSVMSHKCVKNSHPMEFEVDLSDCRNVPACQTEGCSSTVCQRCFNGLF